MKTDNFDSMFITYQNNEYKGTIIDVYDGVCLIFVSQLSWICVDYSDKPYLLILDFSKNKEDGIKYIKGGCSLKDLQVDQYFLKRDYTKENYTLEEDIQCKEDVCSYISQSDMVPLTKFTWYFVPTETLIKLFVEE